MSLTNAETKMNSANLAVVFGPTLTRAPPDADPRLMHNDVPAINVLIQLCIEQNEFLFGADEMESKGFSPPPPPEAPETPPNAIDESALQYPVAENGNEDEWMEPPSDLDESTDELLISHEEPHPPEVPHPFEALEVLQPPEIPPRPPPDTPEIPLTFGVPHPPEVPRPPFESPKVEYDEETCPLPDTDPSATATQEPTSQEPASEVPKEPPTLLEAPPTTGLSRALASVVSISTDINFVDETMQDIVNEIEDMKRQSVGTGEGLLEEGEDDGDSDSDAEGKDTFQYYYILHSNMTTH